jgi:hypothetical protein
MERGFKANPGQYIFSVLTFDPKKWQKKDDAYRAISQQTNKLIKRLEREFGKIVGVVAVEQHANGWPHVNLVFKFQDGILMDAEWVKKFEKRWLVPNAIACGFGKMNSAALIKEGEMEKVLSYVSKTGLSIAGELNKDSQIPMSAPKGFRRIRSIRGFLVSLKKESEYTGEIVKSNIELIDILNENNGPEGIIEKVMEKYPQAISAKRVEIVKCRQDKIVLAFKRVDAWNLRTLAN